MIRVLFWFALTLGTVGIIVAETPSVAADAKKEVMSIEQARTSAPDHSDVAALDRIMADDVTYIYASGKADAKQSYLKAICSGQLHYISWQPKDLHVRILGESAAVINGEYAVRVTDFRVQPNPFDMTIFTLTVYARRNGHWQQIPRNPPATSQPRPRNNRRKP